MIRYLLNIFLCFALCAVALPADAQDVAKKDVMVRIGTHKNYTRIVFDFPKLVAYYPIDTDEGINIRFETPLDIKKIPSLPDTIKQLTVKKPDADTLIATIDTDGAKLRHYRLLRRIVIDVYPGQKKDPVQRVEKTPAAAPELKTVEKPAALVQEPEIVTAALKEEAPSIPLPVPEVVQEDVPPQRAEEDRQTVEEPEVQADIRKTRMTISSIEPIKLAVFKRFGYLWIVSDAKVSGLMPKIVGPAEGLLGKPRLFNLESGTVWRYVMVPRAELSVQRMGLSWHIDILEGAVPDVWRRGAHVRLDVDRVSGKAKLMTLLKDAGSILRFEDPLAGDTLYVVPVGAGKAHVGTLRRFSDLTILPAVTGMVVQLLSDDVEVKKLGDHVMVMSPRGIALTPNAVSGIVAVAGGDQEEQRLFDFLRWRQGGIEKLYKNKFELEKKIADAGTSSEKITLMMRLALLYFSNNFGHEAMGVLRLIKEEDEVMADSPNFIAVEGAALALAGYYHEAMKRLLHPSIQKHPEIKMWAGYVAAASEQWRKADQYFPAHNFLLSKYPDNLAVPFTVYMAESALRLGRTDTATAFLDSLQNVSGELTPHYRAAIDYLRGEVFRQEGDPDRAIQLWQGVADGRDRLYHTKAGFALANLQFREGHISLEDTIDKVDALRFAWRGDGLEVQILNSLGKLKVQNKQYLAGMQDMVAAVKLSDSILWDSAPIREEMQGILSNLYGQKEMSDISPLEAVSLYEEFKDLMPGGETANVAKIHFANFLVQMDLLSRAAEVYTEVLQTPQGWKNKVTIGTRLAAVHVLDNKPEQALDVLARTEKEGMSRDVMEERTLLKAKSYAQINKMHKALRTLADFKSDAARRLEIDILWGAGRWPEAAIVIESLLPDKMTNLTKEELKMIVNLAVAAKLSGDMKRLEKVRTRYAAVVKGTPVESTFGVVTRAGGATTISDRETILQMAGEVDMFKVFFDAYKSGKSVVRTDG